MTTAVASVAATAVEPVDALLAVDGLTVGFATAHGWVTVVEDVTFSVNTGETVGLVGESGSGKTVTALSLMGLIDRRAGRVTGGTITFDGRDLTALPPDELRRLRGDDLSMIFQEPMSSLNPAFTIGNQIAETVRAHRHVSRAVALRRAVEMLELVGVPDPHRRVNDFPHAFSGGMRQRAMIAMALACEPKLLIADEPTTALDVTIQAQVLDLLRSLQRELGMAVLFVTHDLGVVADLCDRVVVMYAGQVVEQASVTALFARPRHPYTEGLLAAMPQLAPAGTRLRVIPGQVPLPERFPSGCRFHPRCPHVQPYCSTTDPPLTTAPDGAVNRCLRAEELSLTGSTWVAVEPSAPAQPSARPPQSVTEVAPLLEVSDLRMEFPVHSGILRRTIGQVRAVDGISFTIDRGRTLGLVGESGSGKSTTARLVLRLIEPTGGRVVLEGADVTTMDKAELRRTRRRMQIVFQDPYSSLDPRSTVVEAVGEPLEVHLGLRGAARDARVVELLESVGLGRAALRRYPHEFSGGQRQRIAVARALALDPSLLICDEPVSSLDVSTQSQVVNLLGDLQDERGLTYLFIAHDLSVVRHISDRIAVMYLGRIVEIGDAEEVYNRPTHPYTQALLSAIPVPEPAAQRSRHRIVLQGDVPSPFDPPSGCRFHTRCPYAMDVCRTEDPPPFENSAGTTMYCHLHTVGPQLAGEPVSLLQPTTPKGEQ